MTSKLTITDERVISVIERLEHYACNLKWTNVRGAQDLLTAADGLRELQERRKAAMDSEPAPDGEQLAIENFCSAMEGIGHIRRTLEETFGGLHGTHVEPDALMDCKTICDAIYAAYSGNSPVIPDGSKEALSEAVAAIYFTDSTDYLPALYSVVKALSPEIFAQLLSNEKAAFDATRLPAAPQEVPDGQR